MTECGGALGATAALARSGGGLGHHRSHRKVVILGLDPRIHGAGVVPTWRKGGTMAGAVSSTAVPSPRIPGGRGRLSYRTLSQDLPATSELKYRSHGREAMFSAGTNPTSKRLSRLLSRLSPIMK